MINKTFILIITLIATSCAGTDQYIKTANQNSYENETAKIYVLRPSSAAPVVKYRIYQGDTLIGKLGPKSYLVWNVKPDGNNIRITSKSENKDFLVINPQPGKTYYIKQRVKLGFIIPGTGLEFIEEQEAKELLKKLKEPKSKYAE